MMLYYDSVVKMIRITLSEPYLLLAYSMQGYLYTIQPMEQVRFG